MCVYLYSFTMKAYSDCKAFETYARGTDQQYYVEYHSWCFCQVPSSPFLKMSYISPPKTPKDETCSKHKLERKPYDIWFCKKMIYIEIGYKSAAQEIDKWQKDTKDEEATLIMCSNLNSSTLNQVVGISI